MEQTGKLKHLDDLLNAAGGLEPQLKARADAAAAAIRVGGFQDNAWLFNSYFGIEEPGTVDEAIAALNSIVYPLARAQA